MTFKGYGWCAAVVIYPSALKKIFLNFLLYQVAEEFKHHARERKFVVREFSYNEADLAAGKNEITKLVTDKKKQFVSIPPNVQLAPSITELQLAPSISELQLPPYITEGKI